MIKKSQRPPRKNRDHHNDSLILETLEKRLLLSTVQIFAAGAEGDELMRLQIDGNIVQSWTVSAGADTGQFQTYTYTTPDTITADQVRVEFANDLFDPANGINRDLRVDAIEIDGQRFETEGPDVFSTATYDSDGLTPGFKQNDILHANGYFQYAGGSGNGSEVTVRARGDEGGEQFQLIVNGSVAGTFTTTTTDQSFRYTASGTVTADQVRVQFINDTFDPANGIDSNLQVDYIEIDGVRYETESPSTFSTGTYVQNVGIQGGNPQSETLHANGYFQYASNSNNGSVIGIRARGDEGGEQFRLIIDGNTVSSFTVDTSFQTFNYTASGNVTADQVRIEFFNDTFDAANGIDSNLVVNFITVDGSRFETEASTTFSTGTYFDGALQSGFPQDEILHANGYFQYLASSGDGGELRLVSSVYSVSESGGSILLEIIRENGSDGAASIEYDTVDSSAVAGLDYQARSGSVSWANGESGIRTVSVPIINDSQIEGNEQFSFTIDNATGNVTLLAPRTATITIDDNDSVAANGDGLLGEYFDNIDFTNRFIARTDGTVNFDWGTGSPAAGIGANTFSVRWTGQVEPRFSETYTFRTTTDDGVRLWVNDQLIIDQFVDQAATAHEGSITLEAGVRYDIRMEYYENGGDASASLQWSSASQPLQIIPTSQLYAADDPGPPIGNDLQAQTILSGLSSPTSLDFTPDGRNLYIAQKDGLIFTVHEGVRESTPFIDIRNMVNNVRDRGLLDIAVHPDFENNPYVYLLFTYDPPEVFDNSGLAGPDGVGNRAGRLIRVTADASNDYRTAVAGSEVILLGENSTWDNFNGFVNSTSNFNEPPAGINPDGSNIQDFIASDSSSHTIGGIEFGLDGNLFVSIGDGTSFNAVDPRTIRVQDIDNLSGKVLRIDPITGDGLSDNPFFSGDADANRSKVYQLGLRNPFRLAVDPDSGELFIGDVGWTQWEEINTGGAGANFGWPYYEGGSGVSLQTNRYEDLPEAQIFYASGEPVTAPIYALNHSQTGINAIVLGDFYSGNTYPEQFQGDLFFNDLGQGIVRNVSFDSNGNVSNVETFTTGAQIVVHIQQGPDGNLYYIDLNDGTVGRWVFV